MIIENSVVLVTGGASGMGLATASTLVNKGAKVAIIDCNEDRVNQVAKDIGVMGIVADVREASSLESAFQSVTQSFGFPQICIHCAGMIRGAKLVGPEGPMSLELFQSVIETNLIGTFNLLRIAASGMKKLPLTDTQERGVLITTASIAGYEGQIGQVAYSASKAGVMGMTLPIARELAEDAIRIMSIAPGLVETPMLEGLSEKLKSRLQEQLIFPKRFGQAEEFAKLAVHIIENPLLNGEVIRLDGAVRLS